MSGKYHYFTMGLMSMITSQFDSIFAVIHADPNDVFFANSPFESLNEFLSICNHSYDKKTHTPGSLEHYRSVLFYYF